MSEETVYTAIYHRPSKVKQLFVFDGTAIRVSGDAKALIAEFIDKKIGEAVLELVEKLPTFSRGDNQGKLKRITLMKSDLEPAAA